MDLQNAMSVIESCAGFTDDSTPAGEAWSVVQAEIERLKTVVGKLTGARLESIRESRAILEGTRPQTVMDHKYVDGKCHEQGCQALVLRDQINEQYLRYLDGSEAVRKLQDKVERLKDEVRDLEDCREHLRRLGEISGCDHVESPDERAVQVSHIEQAFDRLQDEVRLLKSGTNYVCDREQRPTVVYFSNGRKVWVVDDPKGAYLDVDWQAVIKPAEGSVT